MNNKKKGSEDRSLKHIVKNKKRRKRKIINKNRKKDD